MLERRKGRVSLRTRRFCVAAVLTVAALFIVPGAFAAPNKDKDAQVQLLAFNDLHGNIQPPTGSGGRIADPNTGVMVDAGGAEYFATHIKQLRMLNTNTVVVASGDAIGASPLISALFHDEPTIEAMNLWGTEVQGVGNHEFDEGVDELLRIQYGNQNGGDGCHPEDGCQDGDPYVGALFQYLAANVFWKATNETILPAYEIRKIDNAKIAFIGLTLEGTPAIVSQAGIEDVYFTDEVETVNALVTKLRAEQGVRAFVVLVHEGGQQNPPFAKGFEDINGCENFNGPIVDIAKGLDPQVDLVLSAHTHRAYSCVIEGLPVTSASSFGRLITDVDLVIDHESKDVKQVTVTNRIVTRDVAKDPAQTALIAKYDGLSAPIANRIVGRISADITRAETPAGESALGDVIGDAQQWATSQDHHGGAVVAFMNPGGIRADLIYNASAGGEQPGEVTFKELFDVQPFTNYLVTKTMTGAQINRLLEQQWSSGTNATSRRILQVSAGFTYTYDGAGLNTLPARTDRVVPGSVKIGGVPVDPLADYQVTMNSFLADGGDNFTVFREGRDPLVGLIDVDAAVNYFEMKGTVDPGPRDRITRIN
jgi:5'-nucleotidase